MLLESPEQLSASDPSRLFSRTDKAIESNIGGGRDGEMSTCFGNHNLLTIEDLAGSDLQKKGFPAIRCIPNPPDRSEAREKAMKSDMFGKRGGEISECVFFEMTISGKLKN